MTAGRNPFEVILVAASLLAGIAGILTGSGSQTIHEVLPTGEAVWNIALTIGAATAAIALMLPPPMTLLIERVAMCWLAALFVPFGVAIYLISAHPLSTGAFLITGYGLACVARVVQISHYLTRLHADLQLIAGRR